MSNPVQRPVLLAFVIALAGSSVTAGLLHAASDRSEAASIVVVAILWGALVVAFRRWLNDESPVRLIAAALLVRLPLVGTPPLLSDDLYRYLFEGRALWAGHNPLLAAPETLTGVDDALLALVNHPDVSTVYPPVALLWFRLLGPLGTAFSVQLATALVDALTPLGLAIATRRAWPAWIYALHPLPVIEGAHSGHLDLLAVAFAVWGVAAWRRGWPIAAGTAFLAGGGVKLLPFALLPRVLWRLRHRWWVFVAWGGLGLAISGAVIEAGQAGLGGLQRYASEWQFNPLVFAFLEPWFEESTRFVLVPIGLLAGLWALRHPDPARTWLGMGTAFVILSPTVHPWYLLWAVLPGLLCLDPRWAVASVGYLPAYTVLLTFDPTTGEWSEATWLPYLTWGPVLAAYVLTPATNTPQRSRSPPRTGAGTATTDSSPPK